MKNRSWILKGVLYGIVLWTIVYVGLPYFDPEVPMEPEAHLLHLLFAIPAGIAWGYYRFVMLPKKMKKFEDKK